VHCLRAIDNALSEAIFNRWGQLSLFLASVHVTICGHLPFHIVNTVAS